VTEDRLPVLPVNTPPLFAHQDSALKFLKNNNYCGLIAHEPGLGKTRTALTAYLQARMQDPNLKTIVIAPLSLLEAAWHNDMQKFTPHLTFQNAHGGKFDTTKDVNALNYEFFQKADNIQKFLNLFRPFKTMAVLDESSKIKNYAALTTKNLLLIRMLFKYRICMSGTPAPNDESEYWAQMEFTRPFLLGKSFRKFQRTYFYLRNRSGQAINMHGVIPTRQVMQNLFSKQGAEWAITDKSRESLFKVIGSYIHAAKKDECLDLPEQIDEVRLVQMGTKQRIAYKQMKNLLVAQIQGEDVVAQVALSKLVKLREICSGFAISENNEIVETECPKLNELEEILDELGDRQVIIFGTFTWEIEKILDCVSKRATATALYGGTADKQDSISGFIEGRYRYLVANMHSASHGLTLVNASHIVYFSMDYSWEAYEQSRARVHRAGQKNTCVYYHILAENSIDVEILEILKRKGNAQDLIFKIKNEKTLE